MEFAVCGSSSSTSPCVPYGKDRVPFILPYTKCLPHAKYSMKIYENKSPKLRVVNESPGKTCCLMRYGFPESRKAEQQADKGHGAGEAECAGILPLQHLSSYPASPLAQWQGFSTILQKPGPVGSQPGNTV